MKVVSSAKIKRSIQRHLKGKHPDIRFVFCAGMEEAERELRDADIFITYGGDLRGEHIHAAERLKWIMVISAGVDRMPAKEIMEKDILVTNARGIHAIQMAEYTFSMMLHVSRSISRMLINENEKLWDQRLRIEEITGKTIAILGTGTIGREIARIAKAFRMTTLGYNRSGKTVEAFDEIVTGDQLNELLPRADFVVSVLPGTDDTHHLIGKAQFQAMKEEAIFINIGRGSTVCEEELLQALQKDAISHAVLDVFKKEPLERDHPFWKLENVTVTPHLSGISPHYQPRAFNIFEHNLNVFLSGEGDYINKVHLQKGY